MVYLIILFSIFGGTVFNFVVNFDAAVHNDFVPFVGKSPLRFHRKTHFFDLKQSELEIIENGRRKENSQRKSAKMR